MLEKQEREPGSRPAQQVPAVKEAFTATSIAFTRIVKGLWKMRCTHRHPQDRRDPNQDRAGLLVG